MGEDIISWLIFGALILIAVWYSGRRIQKSNDEINRAVEKRIKEEEDAKERLRIYNENYQREDKALKKRILDGLKAIKRGDRQHLDPDALEAAKALQARQGSGTIADWWPLMKDLSGEITDPVGIHDRLDELLYPETLENVDDLKRLVVDDFNRSMDRGEAKISPEAMEAGRALNKITQRKLRKQREEHEAEVRELRLEREKDKRFREEMDEMAREAARGILHSHGLPDTALDGLPLNKVLAHVQTLRLLRELEKRPSAEREQFKRDLDSEDDTRVNAAIKDLLRE
jgi:hypothetical protein